MVNESSWIQCLFDLVGLGFLNHQFQELPLCGVAHGCYLQVNNPNYACIYSYGFRKKPLMFTEVKQEIH